MIGSTYEGRLAAWLASFQILFTCPTWRRVLILVEGAVLTPHRRTASAALRATGKSGDADFGLYHAVLHRCRWSALAAARILLLILVNRFAASGPIVIGLDDTIERRWGAKITITVRRLASIVSDLSGVVRWSDGLGSALPRGDAARPRRRGSGGQARRRGTNAAGG